jgi:predicted amidohydrolase YtcJ
VRGTGPHGTGVQPCQSRAVLVARAKLDPHPEPVDLRIENGQVAAVGEHLDPGRGEDVLDARGAAVIPGLHDHHVHLSATAARLDSTDVGPGAAGGRRGFERLLRNAPTGAGGWIRAVGYHESVAGALDRDSLDALHPAVPVRVQHSTGALWILNSAAIAATGLDDLGAPGVERDADGRVTGRIWRLDAWLREVTPPVERRWGELGREAAAAGVTGFTDATARRDEASVRDLRAAAAGGALPQRQLLLRSDAWFPPEGDPGAGAYKIVLDDESLPDLDALADVVRAAHDRGVPVAVHCVTRVQTVLTAAAIETVGPHPGDRIEHGSVVPADLVPTLARLGVAVVTQPGFIADRGDRYLAHLEPHDVADLYRARSLVDGGVTVAAGSDAPFGPIDPWTAIRAARTRSAPSGVVVGLQESVSTATALGWYLADPQDLGRVRSLHLGAAADLVVLFGSIDAVLRDPDRSAVRATVVGGVVVHSA